MMATLPVDPMGPRDWFASAILVGMMMQNRSASAKEYAEIAFKGADEMMEARAKITPVR
jgi:hypothetical protein